MAEPTTIFIGGIIQGSLPNDVHDQLYRKHIFELLKKRWPKANIFDPVSAYPESLSYSFDKGRDAFFDLMSKSGKADMLIAFVPEASMGTAIEMWNAYNAGNIVIAVSPLIENWVIKFLADAVVPDLEALEVLLMSDTMDEILKKKIKYE